MDLNDSQKIQGILASISVCAGYLNCLFKQGQLQRPLELKEIAEAESEAQKKIIQIAEHLAKFDSQPQ